MKYLDNYKTKIIYDEVDNDYIAIIPDIPEFDGVSAFGDTPEKALEELEIALSLWFEIAYEDNLKIPEPNINVPV